MLEYWNIGIMEYWVLGIWQNGFIGQIIMTKNSIRYLPLNPLLHYSNTPIAKRGGAKFICMCFNETQY
jgi:hypothetical protein